MKQVSGKKIHAGAGFTLIELLVVIAIIGILASIVLASLVAASAKGVDSAIKSEVNEARTLMEFNATDYKSYANLQPNKWADTAPCSSIVTVGAYASKMQDICDAILSKEPSPTAIRFYLGVTGSNPQKYSIMVYLPGAKDWYCVGSSGNIYEGPVDPGSGNWTGAGCYANP